MEENVPRGRGKEGGRKARKRRRKERRNEGKKRGRGEEEELGGQCEKRRREG